MLAAVAVCLLAAVRTASAGTDDDALLAQVKQLAAQGQNPQTAQQVNEYVDGNKDAINAILNGYAAYLKQLKSVSDDNDAAASPVQGPPAQTSGSCAPAQNTTAPPAPQSNTPQAGMAQATAAQQSSTDIQPSSGLQASSDLQTSHLAGYPALPAGDPVTSVKQLTADQLAYAARVRREDQARKDYLMAHPNGYTY